jgi:tetratricopeptide (TPR) repeat protein
VRKLNFPFILGILAMAAAIAGGIYFGRPYQVKRHATELTERARRAVDDQNLGKAADLLKLYLSINREDGPAWSFYAHVIEERARAQEMRGRDLERVYLVHEEALRHNSNDRTLESKCADLAMELGRTGDARQHLEVLYQHASKDARGEAADAGIEDLLGQCDRGESKFAEAEKWFRKAITHDPAQVASYDRLARMLRLDLRPPQPQTAEKLIALMVEKCPKLPRAYLNRWRYQNDFPQAGGASNSDADIKKALELGPDDPEVLLVAASFSLKKGNLVTARQHLHKGLKRYPTNVAFPIALAELELYDRHPERAADVLRQAAAANPRQELWYLLAETLINQGKIEGQNQGADCLDRLRKSGLPEAHIQYLEALILVQNKAWAKAVAKINTARALLASQADPAVRLRLTRLSLLLPECYGRLGLDEQRLAALKDAAGASATAVTAGQALAEELARSGKLDDALRIQLQLVETRPESRLDLVRLLIEKVRRLPREQRARHAREIEQRLDKASKALPARANELALLRAEWLTVLGRFDEARRTLQAKRTENPRDVRCRVALAAIAGEQGNPVLGLEILDQAERDLGPSLDLALARCRAWASRGGDEAKAAIAKLAESGAGLSAADQPVLLDELGMALYRLGDREGARTLWSELSKLQPDNLAVLNRRARLAVEVRDRAELEKVVYLLKQVEGNHGTLWRYARDSFLIDEAARSSGSASEAARLEAGKLAAEVCTIRPNWWGGFLLSGQLADLAGKPEDAARFYQQAVDLGATQPDVARRLVALLYQLKRIDQIDQVVLKLSEGGLALDELKLATAINALHRQDFDKAVTLAREAISESSTKYLDLLFLSRILRAARRGSEAEKPLKRAIELAPRVADVWVDQVRFLVEARRSREIPQVIELAERALPRDHVGRTLALCHEIAGNHDEAAKLFESALKRHPDDPLTLRLAAEFYGKMMKFDKLKPLAAKLLDPRTKASPADVAWAKRSLALVKISSGAQRQIDEALALVDQNLKDSPYSFDDQVAHAVLLSSKPRRRADAIRELEVLERTGLLGIEDHFLLAKLYDDSRQWPKCRDQMLTLARLPTPNPVHLAYFVKTLTAHGELDQAERWLRELKRVVSPRSEVLFVTQAEFLKTKKRDAELLGLLETFSKEQPERVGSVAKLCEKYGFPKEAEHAYRAYAARNAKEPARVFALVGFLARQHRSQEALALCEQAWKSCPAEQVASACLTVLEGGKNVTEDQRDRVGTWLEEARRRQPDSVPILVNLATVLKMQERYDQSEAIYREALDRDPENVAVLNNLAWFLAFRPGRSQEALELVTRAIEKTGGDATLLDTRGVIHLILGKPDLALQDLRDAISFNAQKPILYVHLARAYKMAKNAAEARKAWKHWEELGIAAESVDSLERGIVEQLRQEMAARDLRDAPGRGS